MDLSPVQQQAFHAAAYQLLRPRDPIRAVDKGTHRLSRDPARRISKSLRKLSRDPGIAQRRALNRLANPRHLSV
jgi:hypothetical protein